MSYTVHASFALITRIYKEDQYDLDLAESDV